jgi:hypothetical protein
MLNRENLMPDLDWEALWTVERWLNDSTLVVEVVTIWATFIPPACPGSPAFDLKTIVSIIAANETKHAVMVWCRRLGMYAMYAYYPPRDFLQHWPRNLLFGIVCL